MNRVWRAVLLVAMVCFALGAMAIGASAKPSGKPGKPNGKPSKSAGGSPGQLDPTFGEAGKVAVAFPAENAGATGPKYELPFTFTPGHLEMASAPGGKTVVAGATKVVRYLANGKLDPGFGDAGSITSRARRERSSSSPASPSTRTDASSSPAWPGRCRATRPPTRS